MYVFPNDAPQAHARLAALAAVHDAGTIRHLAARGVGEGWACLEVGGGLGTITRWLAERVGPRGRVVTTDLDTRFLDEITCANVEVWRHDVLVDPLPAGAFDLVCARLVVEHLAEPDLALDRMATALRPGGWLVVEDFELPCPDHVDTGTGNDAPSRTLAAMWQVTKAAGVDPRFGLSLGQRLGARGLTDVGHEGRVHLCRGGTVAARLVRLNIEQLRAAMLSSGLAPADLEADLARLGDERCEWRSPTLWTAWGKRKETT